MWIIFIFLCVVVLVLLKYVSYLRQQVTYYQQEENRQFKMHQSNVVSKKMLADWLVQKDQKKEVVDYLRKNNIKRIAIYGMAEVGELLYRELSGTDITVVCGIDKSKAPYGRRVVKPDEFSENVDAIVVTAIYYFSEIYDFLSQKLEGKIPIIGLDEIIFELNTETQ